MSRWARIRFVPTSIFFYKYLAQNECLFDICENNFPPTFQVHYLLMVLDEMGVFWLY